MEATVKRDHLVTSRGISRQLDGAFNCLRPGICKKNFFRFSSGHGPAKPLGQLRHALVIKVRSRHVNQLGGLLLNRGDHFRVAMSSRAHGNTRCEVEEGVAVHVLDDRTVPALGHQRIVACIGRRHEFRVLLHDSFGVRPGQRRHEPGCFHFQCRGHFFLRKSNKRLELISNCGQAQACKRTNPPTACGRKRIRLSLRRRVLAAGRPAGGNPGRTEREFEG